MTALGFAMVVSSISGFSGPSFAPSLAPEVIEARGEVSIPADSAVNKISSIEKPITVEEYIRNYFSDIPVMIEIARCESRFRQFDKSGAALRGEQNILDRGVMQINEYYHSEDSKKLGFDILTLEGNASYARYLFYKYGVAPWKSSYACWGRTTAYSEYKDLAMLK